MKRFTACLCAGLILALAGCLAPRTVIPTRYYTLAPQLTVETADPLKKSLGYRPLDVAQPYDRRMAYLGENYVLGYRDGEEWSVKPGEAVTQALADALAASRHFQDVGNAAEMGPPDLMLTGKVRKFHENRTQSPWTAELEVRLELRDVSGNASVWADTLHVEVPLDKVKTANALAAAMSHAVSQVVQQAVAAMVNAV